MYGCESWTIKEAEHRRINAFELWHWRKLLRVPWTTRRSNQSIQKISPEYSLEGLMLELKLQYFGHLMRRQTHWKRLWCWERLKAREGDNRGWDGWMASPTQWTWVWVGSGSWWSTGKPGVLQSLGPQRVGHDWVTELNWTLIMIYMKFNPEDGGTYQNVLLDILNTSLSSLSFENSLLSFLNKPLNYLNYSIRLKMSLSIQHVEYFTIFFLMCHTACRILVPRPGMEPVPLPVE